jgi:hypothetical protein
VNGAFGGAIFHDFCDKDARAGKDRSFFTNNTFVDNQSQGFGGAIRIGSFQGSCPNTVITKNVFQVGLCACRVTYNLALCLYTSHCSHVAAQSVHEAQVSHQLLLI